MIINLLSLFNLLFFASSLCVGEEIKIGSYKIPKYVQSEKRGTFVELVKKIGKRAGLKIKVEVYPPKRTIHTFSQGKISGYFPALDVINPIKVSKSAPYYYKKDYLFSLESEDPEKEHSKDQKRTNRLCLTTGYPYDLKALKGRFELVYSASDETCFKMLRKGRADFFLCELHTGLRAARNLEIKKFKVDPNFISSMPVYFAFSHGPKGARLAKVFSSEIKKMRESGELSKMFEDLREQSQKSVGFDFDPTKKD